jgi:hypothetical protein
MSFSLIKLQIKVPRRNLTRRLEIDYCKMYVYQHCNTVGRLFVFGHLPMTRRTSLYKDTFQLRRIMQS